MRRELVGLTPDVILTASTTNLTIFQQATSTIPIVFVQVSDPVEQGFVASQRDPAATSPVLACFEFSIGGKWLDLLKEIAPGLAHVGCRVQSRHLTAVEFFMRAVEAAASSPRCAGDRCSRALQRDIEPAFDGFAQQPNGGLILPTDTFTRLHLELIADLAAAIDCRRSARSLSSPGTAA